MPAAIRFDGLVALVTGAGGGLGKEYALAFAERGASVVVNDLGGDIHGRGQSRAADIVVREIRNKGGRAVANYDSVENGDSIVQAVIDNFGRIDIVVNNAGILRDKSFIRMSDMDWDMIHKVHLRGSFLVTRAAWPHMRKQQYGRIIMTTSAAGIYGNFGQANYSAAKMGVVGLSNTLAIEGKNTNIHCNTIAPMAGSRLTETVMPPGYQKFLSTHCIERQYAFQIAKCKDSACCKPKRCAEEFPWLPDPVLANQEHFKAFEEVIGQAITDADRPSSQNATAAAVSDELQGIKTSSLVAQNVRRTATCYECGKPRCIYSKKALSSRESRALTRLFERSDYSCGALITTEDFIEALKPVYVMPLVLYLCSKSCEETGGLFEVGAGWMAKLRWERTKGAIVRKKAVPMSPEAVEENWDKITDFTDSETPRSVEDSTIYMMNLVKEIESDQIEKNNCAASNSKASKINPEAATSFKFNPSLFSFSERDVILYALGIGISTREDHSLNFLHEASSEFRTFPTFAVLPPLEAITTSFYQSIPGLKIDPTRILHGEQYLELFKPFPTMGTLTTNIRIADIIDKRTGAVVIYNCETFDENKEKVAFNQTSLFILGRGNFGGKRQSDAIIPSVSVPNRYPDAILTEKTSVDQAALYRLSGDKNPLHISPLFAAVAGFKTPILHGLCSFAYAVRHVLKQFANDDVTRFKAVKVRFSKVVVPGQTLQTSMWKENNRIHFITKVGENGNVCISGAYVDLTDDPNADLKKVVDDLQCTSVFEEMAHMIKSKPSLSSRIYGVFQWNITSNGNQVAKWTVDLKRSEVYRGEPVKSRPDCILTIDDSYLTDLVSGKLAAPNALMNGKLKVKGNMRLVQKLGEMFKEKSKL